MPHSPTVIHQQRHHQAVPGAAWALAALRVAPLAFLLAMPGSARAWGSLLLIDAPPTVATLAAGGTLWSLPAYPGAPSTQGMLWPALDYYAPGGAFVSTETGVGWNFSSRKDLQAGLRLWPQFGRSTSDGPPGLAPVGTRLQQQAFLNVQALPALLLQSGLLHGSGRGHDGAQLEIGATSGLPLGGDDLLGIGLAASFANRAHRQSYFGVTPDQALASGLPATPMPAGWQDVSLTLSSEHRFNERWHADGQLVLARLLGAAARSPLAASRQQVALTLSLWRDF